MQQYLKTFVQQRTNWIDSINSQSSFLNQLIGIIDGNSSFVEEVSVNYSKVDSFIKLASNQLSGEYRDEDGNIQQFSLPLDNLDFDTVIPGLNVSLASIVSDVSESQQLNMTLAQINDVMLNYGSISTDRAIEIVNNTYTGYKTEDFNTLISILSSSGADVIYKEDWTAILYNFNSEVAEAAANDHLTLDTSTKVVKQYVGSAILGYIGSLLQYAGLILVKLNVILGLIVGAIGLAINWILSSAVNTHFEIDEKALNDELDTPTSAITCDGAFIDETYQNNGLFFHENVGEHLYFWRTKKDNTKTGYLNSFLDLSLNGRAIRDAILAEGDITKDNESLNGNHAILNLNFIGKRVFATPQQDHVEKKNPREGYDFQYIFDEDQESFHYDNSVLLANLHNDDFWYEQIVTAFAVHALKGACIWNTTSYQQHFAADNVFSINQAHRNVYYGGTTPYSPDYSATGVYRMAIQFLFLSDANQNTILSSYRNVFNTYASHISDVLASEMAIQEVGTQPTTTSIWKLDWTSRTTTQQGELFMGSHQYYNILWNYLFPSRVVNNSWDNFITLGAKYGDKIYSMSSIPEKHLVNWPDYGTNAIRNTLLLVAGATIVGAVVGGAIRRAFNNWKTKASYKSSLKVKEAQDAFRQNPTTANAQAMNRAQNWYNFKAKLFGWSRYDAINDWFTPASEVSEATSNVMNIIDLATIKNLITSH